MSDKSVKDSSFRDKVATVDQSGKRIWMFPHKPAGKYYNARTIFTAVYLLVFFGLPFMKVNGHPVFLLDVIDRRFILFGQIFWPQDFFIFAIGMILFIIFIALFTVVFGRVFCGWACPQTIFMEMLFRRIEFWIEGDGVDQKILAKAPWNSKKIIKKVTKWVIFWAVSFIIANTFLAYLNGIDEVKKLYTEPLDKNIGTFVSMSVFTTVFFFVYLWLREQVCTVICPYGRMQGVLLDKDSVIVTYDYKRGEQRSKFNKSETRTSGDCIDCAQCVKVCPTGIDIRNGTQLECINCTACMDACDKMMSAVGLPTGLVRYASENSVAEKKKWKFTWRMKAYSAVMVLLMAFLVFLLVTRSDVGITVLRTPGQLFQQWPNHTMSNLYSYKMLNKTFRDKEVTLKAENFTGEIKLVGENKFVIPKNGYTVGTMFIYMDDKDVKDRKTVLRIGVYEGKEKISTITTSFLGPFKGN